MGHLSHLGICSLSFASYDAVEGLHKLSSLKKLVVEYASVNLMDVAAIAKVSSSRKTVTVACFQQMLRPSLSQFNPARIMAA